jgi:hypothetical protein
MIFMMAVLNLQVPLLTFLIIDCPLTAWALYHAGRGGKRMTKPAICLVIYCKSEAVNIGDKSFENKYIIEWIYFMIHG